MPGRKVVFANDHFYHVYNRGVEKRNIFIQPRNFERFLQTMCYYQFEGPKLKFSRLTKDNFASFNPDLNRKIVEIICYCLMPNHFHFLLKQLKENGISKFISQISNSYTKYFNTKHDRVGALLQGAFQAVLISSDEQLIHLSRYIHLNPVVSLMVKDAGKYEWSSYKEYSENVEGLCFKNPVLDLFASIEDYAKFVSDQAEYGTTLEILKHSTLDYDAT